MDQILPGIIGAGLGGLVVVIIIYAIGFVISAALFALWVRLVAVFLRKWLDREYARARGTVWNVSAERNAGPRNW